MMFDPRWVEDRLSGPISRGKVRLLFGARQTGKTELLRHLLAGRRTRLYNLQESGLRRRFEVDPAAFSRDVRALPPDVRNVVVDEIQKVPALLEEVQALYDASPRRLSFFLTGSSARKLRAGTANLLPGRSHVYRLHPVCGWETAHAVGRRIGPPPPGRPQRAQSFPAQSLSRTLRFGCLPGIRAESAATAEATLAAYVEHYLEEEIRREALVREIGPFVAFLRLAALESGRQTNLAKLSQESRIPASTIRTFYQVLVDTFVGYWVGAYARSTRRRLLTTPRFCFFDVGVRNAAAEWPLDPRILHAQGGPLLEQWVAQELVARAAYLGRGHRVTFWRTPTGVEVDFIFETPREDIPIEVKWTENPRPDDARHVETFIREFPGRARRGYVVCRCASPEQLTARVTAIPWDLL